MKRRFTNNWAPAAAIIGLFLSAAVVAGAQTSDVDAFVRDFRAGTLANKLMVLEDSLAFDAAEFAPFYVTTITFALDALRSSPRDQSVRDMAVVSAARLAESGVRNANMVIWTLFAEFPETSFRIAMLDALAGTAADHQQILYNIGQFINDENNRRRGGTPVDIQVVGTAARVLGEIGDAAAFPVLLDTVVLRHSELVSSVAVSAIAALDIDLVEAFNAAIRRAAPTITADYFFLSQQLDLLDDTQKHQVALSTIGHALNSRPDGATEQRVLRDLRIAAVSTLREESLEAAAPVLVRHFNATVLEFDRGVGSRSGLLDAITALGTAGTTAAAQRLAQYLELINSYTANDRVFDTQITLAVINNLGRIGLSDAYSPLYRVTLSRYPQHVIQAAREAIQNLNR